MSITIVTSAGLVAICVVSCEIIRRVRIHLVIDRNRQLTRRIARWL